MRYRPRVRGTPLQQARQHGIALSLRVSDRSGQDFPQPGDGRIRLAQCFQQSPGNANDRQPTAQATDVTIQDERTRGLRPHSQGENRTRAAQ